MVRPCKECFLRRSLSARRGHAHLYQTEIVPLFRIPLMSGNSRKRDFALYEVVDPFSGLAIKKSARHWRALALSTLPLCISIKHQTILIVVIHNPLNIGNRFTMITERAALWSSLFPHVLMKRIVPI